MACLDFRLQFRSIILRQYTWFAFKYDKRFFRRTQKLKLKTQAGYLSYIRRWQIIDELSNKEFTKVAGTEK